VKTTDAFHADASPQTGFSRFVLQVGIPQ